MAVSPDSARRSPPIRPDSANPSARDGRYSNPADPAKPAKLIRPDCAVLIYLVLSGNSWRKVIRLLPVNACAPNPRRKRGLRAHASASLTSLTAPSTLLRSVTSALSVISPTCCRRTRFVSEDRSRKVEELSPSVQL